MKLSFARLVRTALAVFTALFIVLPAAPSAGAAPAVLSKHVPEAVSRLGLKPVGSSADDQVLHLSIGFPVRNGAELTNLLNDLYDPASPNYRHFLSVSEFASRFGATEEDYKAAREFFHGNGVKETAVHPNRVVLSVDATVADVRRVFHTQIRLYQHPTENRLFYAPESEPTPESPVALLHIAGLDNYQVPKPMSHRITDRLGSPLNPAKASGLGKLSGSGPGGYYWGSDFRTAYAPGVGLQGNGQNCGLLEFDGYYGSDISLYEQGANIPNINLVNVAIDGGIVGPPGGGVGEVSLDIEDVIAMAPGISTLYVYEEPNGGSVDDMLSRMATDNSSRQLSSSWGFATDATSDVLFQEFATQGQSFYQASGDSDAYVGPISTPEDDPYITLVGGTELLMNGVGASYNTESVWNTGYQPPGGAPQFSNYWGSGGGISTSIPLPAWQVGVANTTNAGSSQFRNTPDVAMTADNIWVIAGDNTQTGAYLGTSCAAPLWCGLTALINEQAALGGNKPVGFINPAVYSIGLSTNYGLCFNDITVGNNIWPGSGGLFSAVPGYDLCTGWGTPTGSNLINYLSGVFYIPILVVQTNFITGGNGNGVVDPNECNSLTIVLTNEGTVPATGVQGTLFSTTPGVIVAQSTSSYGTIAPQSSAANQTAFTVSTEPSFICGTPITLTMVVKSAQITETNSVILPSGSIGTPVTFSNTTQLLIPGTNTGTSSIVVSGVQSIGKVTVSLYMQTVEDIGMTLTLVAPNGTNIILSQYNGGSGFDYGSACATNSETVFDDAATNSIVNGAAPFVGTFAPQEPLAAFKLFSGTNVNGIWRLKINDLFANGNALLQCWSLSIAPETCTDGGGQCPGSDLSLAMSVAPNPVYEGSNVVYSLTVSNAGPSSASGVLISQTLPAGFTYVSTSNYPVSVSQSGSTLGLLLGSLPVYSNATVDVVATAATAPAGLATSSATVGSQQGDPNPNNNSASASVEVSPLTADLAVTMTGTPASVLQNGLVTYVINLTNNGPFPATGVTLTATLPQNANFVSATTTFGSLSFNGTLLTIPVLGQGTNVVVTIVISPTLTGTITASATAAITGPQADPNSLNNTASVNTIVGAAADLAVTAYASPSPVIAGSTYAYYISVSNNGPANATGIVLSQTIPAGASYVSSSLGGSVSGNVLTETIGNLAAGTGIMVTDVLSAPTLSPGVQNQPLYSTISAFGQPGDPITNNNSVTLLTQDEPANVNVVGAGVLITSGSANGSIGPTGNYGVNFYLQDVGTVAATNVTATLLNSNGITLSSGTQSYGTLQPGAPATAAPFTFTINSTNGGTVVALLQVQDAASNLGIISYTFVMPVVRSFSNTAFISIPTATDIPEPAQGPASPYPSSITASGITGTIGQVAVTVSNMFHSYPSDIGLLLIGPGGQTCVLMDDAGQYAQMNTPTTVTFSPSASVVVPQSGNIVGGTYLPADYNPTPVFPGSPAPSGPYNTNLGLYSSVSVNGTWSLYAYDDSAGDYGAISNGWILSVTSITPVEQLADLAATISQPTNQVVLGNRVTNIWTATNLGPNPAYVYLTNTFSAGLALVSNYMPLGSVALPSGVYGLGTLASGAGVALTNIMTATAGGPQTSSVAVGSSVLDPNLANNSGSVAMTVLLPPADLAAGAITASPTPVVVNSSTTFTLRVTNNGPSNALAASAVFTNGAALQITGASSSAGTVNFTGTVASFNFGVIGAGQIAAATITANGVSTGTANCSWSVTNSQGSDTNTANNKTTASISVIPPIPTLAAGPVLLLAQGSAPYNGAINSGQLNTVSFTITNSGSGPTTNLVATLAANGSLTPSGTSSVNFGAIPAGGSASGTYSFVGYASPGAYVTATLTLADGSATYPSVSWKFQTPVTMSFANTGAITIPDSGPGSPYPSVIQVTALTNGSTNLLVSQVTATLNGFTHSFPHDVEAVLVSPSGQELTLMEHTGGPYGVSSLNLTFADSATQSLPPFDQISGGTYLASAYVPYDNLPSLVSPPLTNDLMASLAGGTANGIWSLYVYDDTVGNNGIIANGWSVTLTGLSPVNPPAQLQVQTAGVPNPAGAGVYTNYQIIVNNLGPNTANNVWLTNTLTSDAAYGGQGAVLSQGTFSINGQTLVGNLGAIPAGGAATVTVFLAAINPGAFTNTAVVSTINSDLYTAGLTSVTVIPVTGSGSVVNNPPPTLSALSLSGGFWRLNVNGTPGQNYAIETSTDLIHWTSVATNSGSFSYTDTEPNAPQRYYRAVQVP